MATHSSVLAWRIPGMGEPGGLLSMGSHRVGHEWHDLAAAAAAALNRHPGRSRGVTKRWHDNWWWWQQWDLLSFKCLMATYCAEYHYISILLYLVRQIFYTLCPFYSWGNWRPRTRQKPCVCMFSCSVMFHSFDHMNCSPQGSAVHGILQERILEWVAISFSRGSSQPRDQSQVSWVSYIDRQILYHWATWEACQKPYSLSELIQETRTTLCL